MDFAAMRRYAFAAFDIPPWEFDRIVLADWIILEDAFVDRYLLERAHYTAHGLAIVYGMRSATKRLSMKKIERMIQPRIPTDAEWEALLEYGRDR